MSLREELQNRADKLDAELLALSGRIRAIERESDDVHTCINALDIAEMDAQDAALEPAPAEIDPFSLAHEEHLAPFAETNNHSFWEVRWDFSAGYYDCQRYAVEADALAAFDVLHTATLHKFDPDMGYVELGRKSKHSVPAPAEPEAEEADEPAEHISILTGDPAVEPESGLHADPEPTELDAPASIVDDPELLAAVARAEATLQEAEPAYVGLQDPELDAEYEAMREREQADRKLHFSIFGMKREDA